MQRTGAATTAPVRPGLLTSKERPTTEMITDSPHALCSRPARCWR